MYLDILGLDLYSYGVGHLNRQDPASVRAAFAGMATIAHRYGKAWGIFELGAGIPDRVSAEIDDACTLRCRLWSSCDLSI